MYQRNLRSNWEWAQSLPQGPTKLITNSPSYGLCPSWQAQKLHYCNAIMHNLAWWCVACGRTCEHLYLAKSWVSCFDLKFVVAALSQSCCLQCQTDKYHSTEAGSSMSAMPASDSKRQPWYICLHVIPAKAIQSWAKLNKTTSVY